MDEKSKSQSITRLAALGLSKGTAVAIVELFALWCRESGEEWAVNRLKEIKNAYLHHLIGQPVRVPWLKQTRHGRPKGPFGALWHFGKRDVFRCWNALMMYTMCVYPIKARLPRFTSRQYAKFIAAVNRPPVDPNWIPAGEVMIENAFSCLDFPRFTATTGMPIHDFHGSGTRVAPDPSGYLKTAPEEETVVNSIQVLALRPQVTQKHWKVYSGTLKGFEETWQGMVWTVDNAADRPLSGRIGVIQEPGYKARVVANPYRVHQCAMEPLKQYLFSLFREFPNDYVYNQEGGVAYVQKRMSEGATAHCFDLSNASDRLPLSLQVYMLRKLHVPDYWIDAFVDISHGDWELPSEWVPASDKLEKAIKKPIPPEWYPFNGRRYLRWTEGQPLGLGPSFAAAFLLHHCLVVGIHVMLHAPLDYAMVGDDLVLFNAEVSSVYQMIMSGLGVEISKEKSIISNRYAEFLSRIISKDMILRGYKYRGTSDNSFWDIARNLGPKSLKFFRRRQRRVLEILGPLPEPYGLGWNPNGEDYWTRLEPWIDALETIDVRVRTYVDRDRVMNRKLYSSVLRFTTSSGYPVEAIPDQGIVASLRSVLPADIVGLGALMLPNIEYLAHLRDVGPLATKDDISFIHKVRAVLSSFSTLERATDITQLIRYERLIKKVRG